MRAATPKDKATKAFHPDLPEEDAWFDPINLEKERLNEEDEGKNRQTESWLFLPGAGETSRNNQPPPLPSFIPFYLHLTFSQQAVDR